MNESPIEDILRSLSLKENETFKADYCSFEFSSDYKKQDLISTTPSFFSITKDKNLYFITPKEQYLGRKITLKGPKDFVPGKIDLSENSFVYLSEKKTLFISGYNNKNKKIYCYILTNIEKK